MESIFARKGNKMEKVERTVIHLEFEGRHFYYGSLAAIYTEFSSEQIGIGYGSLRNVRFFEASEGVNGEAIEKAKEYKNSKCIIRKGVLKAMVGGRGKGRKEFNDSSQG